MKQELAIEIESPGGSRPWRTRSLESEVKIVVGMMIEHLGFRYVRKMLHLFKNCFRNARISENTEVDSFWIHFDPIGTPANMTRIGSITFDQGILGIIVGVNVGINETHPDNTLGLSTSVLVTRDWLRLHHHRIVPRRRRSNIT